MGRTLKRVPLDFVWPIRETWRGYINPHYRPCPEDNVSCWGGETAGGRWLDAICRLIQMVGSQAVEAPHAEAMRARGMLYPHPYLEEWTQAPRLNMPRAVRLQHDEIKDDTARMRAYWKYNAENPPKLVPLTEELAEFVTGLSGGRPNLIGGGCEWKIREKLLAMSGMPESFGTCKVCDGHGIDPAVRELHEKWETEEPPTGPGFQLWETTTEGSPISPVFETLEALCAWCADNATTFGTSCRATAEEWRKMLDEDSVCHTEGNMVFS